MAYLHLNYYMQTEEVSEKFEPLNAYNCPAFDNNATKCGSDEGSYNGTGNIPTFFSIGSCSLSILGSLLIFIAYFALKGIRNVAQKIITFLALADFFTAVGYLMADWNFLANNEAAKCPRFDTVCEIQSFVTTWSSMCSFGWTCALALHFYLMLTVKRKKARLSKLLVLENMVIWVFPLLIVLPLLVTKRLGYSRYATSNWCFIRNLRKKSHTYDDGVDKEEMILILIGGKFWEILSYVFVIVVYGMTISKLHKQASLRQGQEQERQRLLKERDHTSEATPQVASAREEAMSGVQQRLLMIPILFILLRMWGTIQFFYSLARTHHFKNHTSCNEGDAVAYKILGIAQAVGDGGQGWSNAFLYILLSPTMRKQLFVYPLAKCLRAFMERKQARQAARKNKEIAAPAPYQRASRIEREDSRIPPPQARHGKRGGAGPERTLWEEEGGGRNNEVKVRLVSTSDFEPSDWSPADSGVYSPN